MIVQCFYCSAYIFTVKYNILFGLGIKVLASAHFTSLCISPSYVGTSTRRPELSTRQE